MHVPRIACPADQYPDCAETSVKSEETLEQPSYSPDLSTSNWHVFDQLVNAVKINCFEQTIIMFNLPLKSNSIVNPEASSPRVSNISWTDGTLV